LSVEAVSLTTGERRWIVPFENPSIPFIADGRVFINDGATVQSSTELAASIYALDLATGEVLWRVPFAGQAGEYPRYPVVVGSMLYVADAGGVIQAVDVESGQTQWQAPSGVEPALSAGGAPLVDLQSVPVADDKHVYILTADGTFRALDRETGQPVWEMPILGTYAAQIYNVNPLTDGTTIVLMISTFTEDSAATPALFSGPALTTVALDARDGRHLWQRDSNIDSMENGSGPVLVDGLFLTFGFGDASDGLRTLTALRDIDGTEAWQSDVIPTQSTWWTMTRGHVVAIVPGGTLVAIDLATGEEAWRAAMPPMEPAIPALITEDKIVVIGHNGEIVVWRI
jgi:outer membrane protein assembly factor BamB